MIKIRALLIILLLSLSAIQAQQVEVSFIVSDGAGSDLILKTGVDPSATDGLDAAMGEAELPPLPPTGIFDARFILPAPPDETVASLNDFRYGNIIPSNEGFVTQHKLISQLGTGSSDLTLCWDIEGVNLNFKDNITGELFNKDITTSGPGCFTVPLNLTTVIVTITYVKSPIPSELNLVPDSLLLESDASSFRDITVTSNVNWSASSNVSWLSLSPVNGSNGGTVRVTATSTNPTINGKNGTVTVVGGGITKTVNITQSGSPADLTLTPSNREVTSSSGSTTFDISSNVSWTVSDNTEWLTVSPVSGSASGVFVALYSENILLTQRIATITVAGGGITRTVTVTQAGASPVLTVAPTSLTLGSSSGSNDKFDISSNTNWTVADNATWLTVSPASGSNNGEVTVTATNANTSLNSRSGIVTITGSGITREVAITQAGTNPVLTVSPDSILLEYNTSNFGDFSVSSNVDWTVNNTQEWLTVSPVSGSNNGSIRATTITDNPSTTEIRIDTITIAGEGITQFVIVAQSPMVASLGITPDSVALSSEAGSYSNINVTSNISWSVSESAGWLNVSPIDGFGDSIIVVTATSANPSVTEKRETTVLISGSGIEHIVKVTQFPSGALLSATPVSIELGSEAESYGDISISSNINWRAINNVSWLDLSPVSGSNNGTVRVSPKNDNTSIDPRNAIVTIYGGGIYLSVAITQLSKVDTIPPATPTYFIATSDYTGLEVSLSWDKNIEDDLQYYSIYREYHEEFMPDSSNLLAITSDTSYSDSEILNGEYFYKLSATDHNENESDFAIASVVVGIDEKIYFPSEYALEQNYPNPFNPSTSISYSVKEAGFVTLTVYNSLGQKVADLVKDYKQTGNYKVTFDANELSSGIYFYKIQTNGFVETKKMILMK